MYGIYDELVEAAKKATLSFDETAELLEYPEVQADKAYYLSVLSRYNALKSLKDKLSALENALRERDEARLLLKEAANSEERDALYGEISACESTARITAAALADALGRRHVRERAYCRFKFGARASKFGEPLIRQLKDYFVACGAKIEQERYSTAKEGYVCGASFCVEGEDVLAKLLPLTGAHKVVFAHSKSEELQIAATPCAEELIISDKDLKIDLFHSSGAGGQNVNKVETAVRVTHIPTGTVVVCQDERSQLKNKQRAIETLKRRLIEARDAADKERTEADIASQFRAKNTPITFDFDDMTMTDARLKTFTRAPFPLADIAAYMDGLCAL